MNAPVTCPVWDAPLAHGLADRHLPAWKRAAPFAALAALTPLRGLLPADIEVRLILPG